MMHLKGAASKFICVVISVFFICGCGPSSDGMPSGYEEEAGQAYQQKQEQFTLNFKNSARKDINAAYVPGSYDKKVAPYQVEKDLSNIENLSTFKSFSDMQKKALVKNAFFVAPSDEGQIFSVYEKNAKERIPSLITSDLVLQLCSSFSNYTLRKVENDYLADMLEKLSGNMLKKSIYLCSTIKEPTVKDAALKNAAYFSVARLIFGDELPDELPPEARDLAQKEYELVKNIDGYEKSYIFPFMIDYSKFKPKGHYLSTTACRRYYTAMAWYRESSFPLFKDGGEKLRNTTQTLQALLITYCLFLEDGDERDFDLWDRIYNTAAFYQGKDDELNVYDYKSLLLKVYGQNPNLEELDSSSNLDALYAEAQKLPSSGKGGGRSALDIPSGRQFRLMGRSRMPDSEIFETAVDPVKAPYPEGLQVLGALGCESACTVLSSLNEHDDYAEPLSRLKDKFGSMPESVWRSDINYGWLRAIVSGTSKFKAGYPSFMINDAWDRKSLSTALSGWSYMRKDGAQFKRMPDTKAGEGSGGDVFGYVEPSVELYQRALWLVKLLGKNLDARGMLSAELGDSIGDMDGILNFLISCSKKELINVQLTQGEYDRIYGLGREAGKLISYFSCDGGKWADVAPDSSGNMAFITDFYMSSPSGSYEGGYKQSGVGPAYEIYAVVPLNGRLYIARGGVFSYFEFVNTTGTLITDEAWANMLKGKTNPAQPAWTSSFIVP